MSGQAPRPVATALAGVTVTVALVTLVAVAAGRGPGRVFRGDGPRAHRISDQTTGPSTPAGDGQPPLGGSAVTAHTSLWSILVTLLLTAVAVWLLWLLARVLIAAFDVWLGRQRARPVVVEVPFDVLRPELLAEDLAAGSQRHRALLEGGTPRNGIVACWHEFERVAERRGMARKPWQTSSEFTLEILDLVQADDSAVSRLAGRYREARFSDHDVTEADRAAALQDLDRILSSLGTHRTRSAP